MAFDFLSLYTGGPPIRSATWGDAEKDVMDCLSSSFASVNDVGGKPFNSMLELPDDFTPIATA